MEQPSGPSEGKKELFYNEATSFFQDNLLQVSKYITGLIEYSRVIQTAVETFESERVSKVTLENGKILSREEAEQERERLTEELAAQVYLKRSLQCIIRELQNHNVSATRAEADKTAAYFENLVAQGQDSLVTEAQFTQQWRGYLISLESDLLDTK